MKQKTIIFLATFVSLALLLSVAGRAAVSLAVGQSAAGATAGTAFTYQGRLEDGSGPAQGLYDLRFELYDDPDAGVLLGAVTVDDVAVDEGLFTVPLDFGDVFDGEARWLAVAVRPGGQSGAYTTLSPRQELTPAPYAHYARGAPWSGLTGVPAGFADGTDDDTVYTAGAGLVLDGSQFSAEGSPYGNVLVVAKNGGDFNSVQAALDSVTDAGAANPYLVYVAPGVYDEEVELKSYVTVEGAGEGTTILRGTGGSDAGNNPTVVGADEATIRHLTVESDATGQAYAVAIYNAGASPTIVHVSALATGGSSNNYAVYNTNASPAMSSVTAVASGGNNSYGAYNIAGSSPMMNNVTLEAAGGSNNNYGVYNFNGSSPTMSNVTITATGNDSNNMGVRNLSGSSPVMSNVTVSALDGNINHAINAASSSSPTIRDSVLEGDTYSVFRDGSSDVEVVNSQLIGARSIGLSCFHNYDENLDLLNCP